MHTHLSDLCSCLLSYKNSSMTSVSSFSEVSVLLSAFGSMFYWHLASTTPFFLFFSFLFSHSGGVQGPQHRLLHIGRSQLLQYVAISLCFNKTLSSFGFSAIYCLTLWGFFHLTIYQAYYAISPTSSLTLAILVYSNAH